jgi:hypothetical protein
MPRAYDSPARLTPGRLIIRALRDDPLLDQQRERRVLEYSEPGTDQRHAAKIGMLRADP